MNRIIYFRSLKSRALRGFTLIELLVVVGLMMVLSFYITTGLGDGGKSTALKSAQATIANLIVVARTTATGTGQSCRVMMQVDPDISSEPLRYLRYLVVQQQLPSGWRTVTDAFLPGDVYLLPGNFSALPTGLFSASVPWTKADGSDLRSTALRSNQITNETIGGVVSERWVNITLSANAGTLQSGDLVLATGRRRMPVSRADGEAPIEFENPANVRGLTLSVYGVAVLINSQAGF